MCARIFVGDALVDAARLPTRALQDNVATLIVDCA
jgi:hypothetical protein